ncbi:ABC transporter substrate-binding protein [Ornithinimicrobium faecis]|uniref:ABC transporter substrate-binding protein n=1 Tax=Ornithinimicrobium faecis TaxID=2934158 RepID=UPI00211995EC|nr:ABC transporter substrate-binding protein [Ornithinimicrobium sp. HY1745]
MKTRYLVVAATALALTAAGCSGKGDPPGSPGEGTAAPGEWSAGTDTVRIGLISAMTGPFAVLGISQQNGMQVVADQINESGGIGGAQIEIVSRDMQLDPGKAVQHAHELAGDPTISFVVGPSITSFYNAASDAFEQQETPNCQPAVVGGSFADLDYGFRMENSATQDVIRNLEYLQQEGITSVGLIYEGDDAGKDYAAIITELGPEYGVELAGYEETRNDDVSHVSYVQALRDAGAIWISNNASGAKTMAAAQQEGYEGQMIGGSGAQNVSFLEAAGDAAEGAIFDAPMYQFPLRDKDSWTPGYADFVEAVEAAYGLNVGPNTGAEMPQGVAVAGDCVYAFAAAADAAESLEGQAVAAAFANLSLPADETPSGCRIEPDEEHESYPLECIRLYQWQQDEDGWYTVDITVGD